MNDQQLETVLATVHELLVAEGCTDAAQVVRAYPARTEFVNHDNWNGGTDTWDVCFDIPAAEYVKLGSRREQLETTITERLKTVIGQPSPDCYSAKIAPARELRKEWRAESTNLPRQTRLNIVDGLKMDQVVWPGALDDVEFLSRLYDLKSLPSHDSRFKDAAGDIWQHTINNNDFELHWVYTDNRFQLMDGSADIFLKFLCETIHPVVRPSRDEALKLVGHYNDQLKPVGWEIIEEERIAGRPRFTYRALAHHGKNALIRGRTVADALDAGAIAQAIQRMEHAIEVDPDLAIGSAKELVESCCKTILAKCGVDAGKSDDLGDLTKRVIKELRLVPKDITDATRGAENIRRILQSLTQIPHHLAELRGLYGTGHGRDGLYRGLQPRHARLAVGSAVAFVDFITETYMQRQTAE